MFIKITFRTWLISTEMAVAAFFHCYFQIKLAIAVVSKFNSILPSLVSTLRLSRCQLARKREPQYSCLNRGRSETKYSKICWSNVLAIDIQTNRHRCTDWREKPQSVSIFSKRHPLSILSYFSILLSTVCRFNYCFVA